MTRTDDDLRERVEAADPASDGRTARRDRNRLAVLDAVIELFSAGELQPSVNEVAERSGVSLRSVYRYFDDGDALIRAAIARAVENVWHLYYFDGLGTGSLDDRIDVLIESRMALYDALAPAARAANQRIPFEPVLAEERDARRDALRRQVARHFDTELRALPDDVRAFRLSTLDMLLQFEALDWLHVHHSRAEVIALLRDDLHRLLH